MDSINYEWKAFSTYRNGPINQVKPGTTAPRQLIYSKLKRALKSMDSVVLCNHTNLYMDNLYTLIKSFMQHFFFPVFPAVVQNTMSSSGNASAAGQWVVRDYSEQHMLCPRVHNWPLSETQD